jgi:hypothetical protein
MSEITYGVTEEKYYLGNSFRIAYGIAAYADTDLDGTATIVASVHDVTDDKDRLCDLVDLCNSLELSVCHLYDVVEDFLAV